MGRRDRHSSMWGRILLAAILLVGESFATPIRGRGASDDKGNMLVPILAVEALLKGEGSVVTDGDETWVNSSGNHLILVHRVNKTINIIIFKEFFSGT